MYALLSGPDVLYVSVEGEETGRYPVAEKWIGRVGRRDMDHFRPLESLLTAEFGLLQIAASVQRTKVLVSEDRLSVNPKRHSVILPVQSSHAVF